MNENSFTEARSLLVLLIVVAAFVLANEQRMRNRSIIRDRAAAMERLREYTPKDFKRR